MYFYISTYTYIYLHIYICIIYVSIYICIIFVLILILLYILYMCSHTIFTTGGAHAQYPAAKARMLTYADVNRLYADAC